MKNYIRLDWTKSTSIHDIGSGTGRTLAMGMMMLGIKAPLISSLGEMISNMKATFVRHLQTLSLKGTDIESFCGCEGK